MGYYNPYQSIPQQYMAQSYYPQFYSATGSNADSGNANPQTAQSPDDSEMPNMANLDHDMAFTGRNLNYNQYNNHRPHSGGQGHSNDHLGQNMMANITSDHMAGFNAYNDPSGYGGSQFLAPHSSQQSEMPNSGNSYYGDENTYMDAGYASGYANASLNGSSIMGPAQSRQFGSGAGNDVSDRSGLPHNNRLNNSSGNSERQSNNSNEGDNTRSGDDHNLLLSSSQFTPQVHHSVMPAAYVPTGMMNPNMGGVGGSRGHSRHSSNSNLLGVAHLMNPNSVNLPPQAGSASMGRPSLSSGSAGGAGGPNVGVPPNNNFQGGVAGGQPGGVNSSAPSRTVYLGNIPSDLQPNELLDYVRSGIIETVKILPTKNCAFISFVDHQLAVLFHSDCILKKLNIKGKDIRIGWGKNTPIYPMVLEAIQNHGATRNVYLGNLNSNVSGSMITEQELREDLATYGIIDCIKIIPEKGIAFVHFLSILSAIKCVSDLPSVEKYLDKKCYYGKDRCAFITKTQQHNAAQYLGLAPGMEHQVTAADREFISTALVQQSAAAARIATQAGGANNLGNRTVYLGNLHQDSSVEEICNVVRGGLLQSIRFLKERHVCFITFIDPIAAAQFFAMCQLHGLTIHNRRIKVGWGKHSGPLLNALSLAVSNGASRNIYVGNILDFEYYNPTKLRDDFSKFGEIEQINYLEEKNCAFINFVNIANAIKAIDGIKSFADYRNLKINFGKDRCGNLPRQFQNQNTMMMPVAHNSGLFGGGGLPEGLTDESELALENSDDGVGNTAQGTISGLEIDVIGTEAASDDDHPSTVSASEFDAAFQTSTGETHESEFGDDLLVDSAANPPI